MKRHHIAILLGLLSILGTGCPHRPAPAVLTPVPDAEAVGIFHTVSKGETLFSICRTYKVDLQEVAELNGISDPVKIRVGDRVFIPDVEQEQPVGAGEPASTTEEKVEKWEGEFIWPVDGVVTSKFGIRAGRRHDGIDISAPEGTDIRAAADGQVLYAGDQQHGYGNLIIIRHKNDLITIYAHNRENLVREDAAVKQGQLIGKVGKTGRATGPHLHFEIRNRTKPRNPLFFLPKPS
jgi:murein DD-endopeptidase MepM/ murein hydrolase activator NlpD